MVFQNEIAEASEKQPDNIVKIQDTIPIPDDVLLEEPLLPPPGIDDSVEVTRVSDISDPLIVNSAFLRWLLYGEVSEGVGDGTIEALSIIIVFLIVIGG